MPVIDGSSPPMTAEDLMATSALEVSPILTASIFDELYASAVDDDTSMHQPLPPPLVHQRQRRHTPLSRLNTNRSSTFELSPPSDRWTRRLSSLQQAVEDEDPVENHIGPIMPSGANSFPRSNSSHFIYGQNCLSDRAYNTSPLLSQNHDVAVNMLDFEIVLDDGGQYGSGRKGAVNILTQYCGFVESGLVTDVICSISKLVIKAPQHGFTAPYTSRFDKFTRHDYHQYMSSKLHKDGVLEDTDPVAWFSLTEDRTSVIDLDFRSAKYVLIKMLRADYESDNIDLQYIGFIGHSGPRSFGCAKLC
ncbi:hypothetical protein [Parasitella parasitica]|uniref:Uncharacterized protein n=1 Tax=Parasitella parasitica TaxID=35722 RepID=A0A0B7NN10_9FUNG|nr:hypothetical protein [Parasitella parasitica]